LSKPDDNNGSTSRRVYSGIISVYSAL